MKLQKLCSPLGISNDHNVTRAILNDTVSGKVILVLFRFSCKLSTLCSLKDQNWTKYLLLQNYMASSVSMILASTAQQVMCMFSLHKKKKTQKKHKKNTKKERGSSRNLRVSHKGADSMVCLSLCHLSPLTSLWISQLAANLPSRTIWDHSEHV